MSYLAVIKYIKNIVFGTARNNSELATFQGEFCAVRTDQAKDSDLCQTKRLTTESQLD